MSRTSSIITMLALSLMSVFLVANPAQADPATQAATWTRALPYLAPNQLNASPDGSVSGTACSYSPDAIASVGQSDGVILGTIFDGNTNGCVLEHAVDTAGVSYVIERADVQASWPAYAGAKLAAYKGYDLLWQANLGTCLSGSVQVPLTPQSLEVGYDGGVYVIGTALEQCSQPDRLMKIDKRTGIVKYQTPLINSWTDGSWVDKRMTAYTGGLVVADSNKLRYFKYDGSEDTTKTVTYSEMVVNHTIADDGSAILTPIWNGQSCPDATFNPGSSSVANVTFSLGECNQTSVDISALPGGKFVYRYYDDGMNWSGNYNAKVFNVDGTVVYDKILTPNGESGRPWNTRVSYDSSGKALVVQIESSGKLSFEVFSATGVSDKYFEASGITTSANKLGPVSLVDGAAYVATCDGSCSNTSQSQGSVLYKFDIAEVSPDYPKGYLLENAPDKRKYVAMGDSFSSGEGVSPFLPGTDVSGVNSCHRSLFAYSMQFEQAKSLEYDLTSFKACSGAETSNLLNGQHNEPSQLTALATGDTDIVTLTIGGNDIGFKDFAAACVTALCDTSTAAYDTAVNKINTVLPNVLPTTYSQILEDLPQDADLYVLSYPHVAPVKTDTDLPDASCMYLYDGNKGSGTDIVQDPWGDARGAYDVTARLNAQIESAVYDLKLTDDRIHFIDVNEVNSPFIGHDVCASDSYFVNVNSDVPSIFHPNEKGQQVLADILISKL